MFQEGKGGGHVQQERKDGEHVEHQKCTSVGTFVVFDTKGRAGNMANTTNMPLCMRGRAGNVPNTMNMPLCKGNSREHVEHQNGMFMVSDTRERNGGNMPMSRTKFVS